MKSFIRVTDNLDNLALDISNAKEKYASYVQQATFFYFYAMLAKHPIQYIEGSRIGFDM